MGLTISTGEIRDDVIALQPSAFRPVNDKAPDTPLMMFEPPRGPLSSLRRRIYLTYKYHGARSVLYRVLTFPLRFTRLRRYLGVARRTRDQRAAAVSWYRRHARPVTIVIPSYRDADKVAALVRSIHKTTHRDLVRIVVTDDASGPEHLAALAKISGIEVIEGESNAGFAANVNRGLRAVRPGEDAVVLNSDTLALRAWLASLQFAAARYPDVGIVTAKLLYADNRIQFAGSIRNQGAPEWFDHRYRFKPRNWGPANVAQRILAATGACMYIKHEVIEQVGLFDESYPMAYEDVDYCLRAWQAGLSVLYWPIAELRHLESVTRGSEVGERERASQRVFWERWGDFFDARNVRNAEGKLRVIYVTEDTGVGGGHRDVFEHLNHLHDRGNEVELWSLGGEPDWFELRVPVRSFDDYADLAAALGPVDAIKVATWWVTSAPVWEASVVRGIPVYFVQDIETSYYPDSEFKQSEVLASYRPEFRYMTISSWNRDRLRELGVDATLIPPGIDLRNFRPLDDVQRLSDMVLALGRSNPLKNLPLTLAAWRALPGPRPELRLFGIEPELAGDEQGIHYVTSPSDEQVNRLLNEAAVFIQSSTHEGFCLPVLEAMAAGCAVVCTDAHGNRDFCEHEGNCLMPDPDQRSVTGALLRLLEDPGLREHLGQAGIQTAAEYSWSRRIDALERFFEEISAPRRIEPSTAAVPELRRAPVR
jgi:GT2 family glycosyltransferase/glycosyltransferase involved in cell wall biosynthesis